MVSAGLQMLGTALGIIGWIMTIVICALPMWKVTAFIGNNIVTAQITWEGIWMSCVVQSTGQMQCKVYDSMLALSSDLQAARALCVISILVGIIAIFLSIAGGKCTNCVEDEGAKAKVGIASGVAFIISGVLCLIPVCWTANTIIRDFYNPLVISSQKYEIGASLMASQGVQIMGIFTAFLGWLGVIIACCLPQWRVTAFIGANIVTAQLIWEGIWMTCAVQSTGQMQCKIYDSMLALSQDLQAARAMIIISILAGILGVVASIAGGKCTNCIDNSRAKATACIMAGVCFIIAGLLCLIPVSWTAQSVIVDFYNPLVTDAQRRELGTSLYIGWAAAGLLLLGGSLLCWNCPPKEQHIYNPKYTAARLTPISREYV
ncbi:claudin-4-like [Tachysurus vachellii]|uniref:claudin-4-like n=1 Tax=Tachysurus vachellii TaxID=175792 RepID=UPI00296B37D3|nr:claudin-4-like [Tachysurus vachellii]